LLSAIAGCVRGDMCQETSMIRYLKTGQTAEVTAEKQAEARRTVEGILENIAKNGERAVREYSQKFDKWSPESFRLSKAQIRECVDQVPDSVKRDIEFAQTQIRNFALA
jgi:sulfopropanediol 3-dehydrogenase